jgi:hypothetical protein
MHLKALGSEAARDWVERHFDSIGARSSVDVRHVFL